MKAVEHYDIRKDRQRRNRRWLRKWLLTRKATIEYFEVTIEQKENSERFDEQHHISWWIPDGLMSINEETSKDSLIIESATYSVDQLADAYRKPAFGLINYENSRTNTNSNTPKNAPKKRTYTNTHGRKIKVLEKYWRYRYDLFSRFDEGVCLDDEEAWYSVTPEVIAQHTAESLLDPNGNAPSLVIDAFCGAGGNAIQFALAGSNVLAVDLDEGRLEMAKTNSSVYGVEEYIDFINADWFNLAKSSKSPADAVFLSPPWGGPDYLAQPRYDMLTMLPLPSPSEMIEGALRLAPLVILFLPKNTDLSSLGHLLRPLSIKRTILVERYLMGCETRHPKAISVYIQREEQ